MKAAGCCPAGLLNSGAGGSGGQGETGDKGNNCSITQNLDSSVNLKSGNLYHFQDVGKLTLSYNSTDSIDGPLGKKWTHNYNLRLATLSANTLALKTESGDIQYLQLDGSSYRPEAISGAVHLTVKNANGTFTKTDKNGAVNEFNTGGYLTSIRDRNENTTALTYNGTDLASITDPNGRTTTITTTGGKITAIIDPIGRTHTLTYTDGLLTAITDPLGNHWDFTYDSAGRMLSKTNPASKTITYTYDSSGKLFSSSDPEGKTRAVDYTQSGTSTFTEKDGGVWTYLYDPIYAVKTSQTDPLGNVTRYIYDLKRNLTKTIYPDNSFTAYTYDANSNLTSVTDPMGKTSTYTYNSLNLVTSATDPKGNTTRYGYDDKGNLTSITDASGSITRFQYDGKGNITSIVSPLNKTTTMVYDAQNNIVSVTDPAGQTTTMTYDAAGNMLTQTDSLNKTTTFQYNANNQLVQVTDPKGNVTAYTYDHNGNLLSAADANTNTTRYLYNYKNKLTKITDALSNATNLLYGGAGCSSCAGGVDKLTTVLDAKNRTTSFEYDLIGSLVKETDPLGKQAAYTYDSKKNLLTATSPDDKTITFSYDLNNRPTRKTYSDGSVTTFGYDDAGNMTYAANNAIAYNFAYDAVNRVTGITDSNNRTIQYQYDAAGNRTQMTTPDGRTITYGYNDNSLPSRITTNLGDFTFTYDAANRRVSRRHPNGAVTTYSYDDNSNLMGITTAKAGTTLDSVSYTQDPVGNRVTKSVPQESWTYTYDPVYRLMQAVPTGSIHQPEAYTYDEVGNRLTGQEPQSPAEKETTQYGYDDENRLTGVRITKTDNVRELAFAYDPFGRRISKTIISDTIGAECSTPNTCPRTTHYVYDGPNIIAEYNATGEVQTRYTHAPGIDEPLAVEVKNGMTFIPYHYHADSLGSITTLSDNQGGIVQRYAYDSFGNITITTQGNIAQPYAFTGREYDRETGMYFYRARYYDPKAGRFVTKDPVGFAGGDVNLYGYVGSNPIMYTDPSGLESYQCRKALGKLPSNNQRIGPDIWGNPLYHQYSCTRNVEGKLVCGGQTRSGSWISSKGKPTSEKEDYHHPDACWRSQNDNRCFEKCLINEWLKDRPRYGIPFGTDCQEYDNNVNKKCRQDCKIKW